MFLAFSVFFNFFFYFSFLNENMSETAQESRNHQVSLDLSFLMPEVPLNMSPMVHSNPDTQQISFKAENWALLKAVLPAKGYLGLSAHITSWERNASQLHWLSHFEPSLASVAVASFCSFDYFAQSCRKNERKRKQPAKQFYFVLFQTQVTVLP